MLIFVLQTLAEILAGGTSLTSTEQIDFSHPSNRREATVYTQVELRIKGTEKNGKLFLKSLIFR